MARVVRSLSFTPSTPRFEYRAYSPAEWVTRSCAADSSPALRQRCASSVCRRPSSTTFSNSALRIVLALEIVHLDRAGTAAALDPGDGLALRRRADGPLVRFGNLVLAAARGRVAVAHRRADAARHEPARAIGDAEGLVQLARRGALLGRRIHAEAEQPLVERDMRPLENGPDPHRELLPAVAAVIPARTHRVPAQRLHRIEPAAARTGRAVGPANVLQVNARLIRVGERRVGKLDRYHVSLLMSGNHGITWLFSERYKRDKKRTCAGEQIWYVGFLVAVDCNLAATME